MTYSEFRKTYKWMLDHYTGTHQVYQNDFDHALIGKVKTTRYERRGGRWAEVDSKREDLTPAFYCNCIDAVPFFRGLGGTERITCGYTPLAYLPVSISSTSPDRKTRIVREFQF